MADDVNSSKYVILDSDVIVSFSSGNYEKSNEILNNLAIATERGYGLAISNISIFEMLNESNMETEEKRIEAIQFFKRFELDNKVLIAASHIGCLYKEANHTISSFGVKIIAATAFLTDSLIFTLNGKDYPRPFFDELVKTYIKYEVKGRDVIQVAYFMKPDVKLIEELHKNRVQEHQENVNKKLGIPVRESTLTETASLSQTIITSSLNKE